MLSCDKVVGGALEKEAKLLGVFHTTLAPILKIVQKTIRVVVEDGGKTVGVSRGVKRNVGEDVVVVLQVVILLLELLEALLLGLLLLSAVPCF